MIEARCEATQPRRSLAARIAPSLTIVSATASARARVPQFNAASSGADELFVWGCTHACVRPERSQGDAECEHGLDISTRSKGR
jgi:hypothetical protein